MNRVLSASLPAVSPALAFGAALRVRRIGFLWAACLALALGRPAAFPAAAESLPAAGLAEEVITSGAQFWTISGDAGDRVYRLQTEIGIHYYDSDWNVLWAEWDGAGCYLDAGTKPLPFRSGQRVFLDGYARPGQRQILWERTKIRVVDPAYAPAPLELPEVITDPKAFDLRVVALEALVSEQAESDATHVRLTLTSPEWTVTAYVHVDASQPLPQWAGAFVRLHGAFSAKYDVAQRTPVYEIWVVKPEHVETKSWLATDDRFALPLTPIEELNTAAPEMRVRVQGVVHSQEPGRSVTLRDDTGQVRLLTRQTTPFKSGQQVEAIGLPVVSGLELRLRHSLVRAVADAATLPPWTMAGGGTISRLRLTDQVRQLPASEAARGYPVDLRGVVTWADPASRSFFLQDASGGVRAVLPADSAIPLPEVAADVLVTGTTRPGTFAPDVRVERLAPGMGNKLPVAERVSFGQVMTGEKYAEWIELRGYVRSVVPESSGLARLELITPGGELIARVRHLAQDHSLVGALVDLQAVCDVIVNDRRQLSGVQLWVPSPEFVQVRESAPVDPFATPLRPIGSLLQIGSARQLHHRVQITGTVTLHRPGTLLYVEEGADRILVLSRQTHALRPGDRVNVVGFPGNDGARLIMREAIYRRLGEGAPIEPLVLPEPGPANVDLDGRVVRIRGQLLDQLTTRDGGRLQVQNARMIFEADWSGALPSFEPGSVLDLTGVYRVQYDEYRQPHTFAIALRQPDEVRVLSRPSWWTASRVAWGAGALLVVVVLTLALTVVLARKNARLHQAEIELQRANSELEARVAARTQDLRLEIAERQRSEEVLAEERKLLRTVIDNLPVHLYVKNATGKFVLSNLLHARLLGGDDGGAVVGKTDFDLYPPDLAERYALDDQRVLQTGEPLILHEEPSRFGERDGWLATTKVPLRDRRGQIVGLIGISQDITERKAAEAEREELNNQLMSISRQAGMAEVATGVLHNVGNVLNSVNVSASMAADQVRRSKAGNLTRIVGLLEANGTNLGEFLNTDPRGRKIPAYLAALSGELVAEQQKIVDELELVRRNIDHIKEIVTMQQSYAKISGVSEEIDLVALVEDALRMSVSAFQRYQITIVRDFAARPVILSDRHRLMQIILNLFNNAKDACRDAKPSEARITVRITEQADRIQLIVIDNGIGIAPDNLTRIFGHGFTTKKAGHGFGLHSAALAAKELGGSITVHSEGLGHGAAFTLEVPALKA